MTSMMHVDPERLWTELKRLFRAWTGMLLPEAMRVRAVASVRDQAERAGDADPVQYLVRLDNATAERQVLLDEIGLGTTWFMRDRAGLSALVDELRDSAPRSATLWIWSVGCSTGEEPYSLAMLLDQAGLPCRILATDINNTALRKARAGRYEARHVQRLPRELHNRYFEPAGTDCVRVVRDIRDRVQFERHNLLVDEGTPSGWTPLDAVLCRNVLIFFECDAALDIVERLARACRPGGYLLLGAVERPLLGLSSLAERSESSDLICVPGGSVPDISPIARRSSGSLRGGGAVVRLQSPRSAPPDETLDARMDEASSLQKRGRLEEALAIVDAAASRAPLSAPVHTVRGVLLKDLGRYGDAIRAFRAACFYDGNAWLAPYELGVCLETQGDAREAYEAYRHALGVLENDGLPGLHDAWGDVAELASTVREICRAHLRRYRELFGL